MDWETLIGSCGEWLRGTGPEADVVISSRIRLARNLAETPFPARADDRTKRDVLGLLKQAIREHSPIQFPEFLEVQEMTKLERQLLVERQLISRELAEGTGSRGVYFAADEAVSLMVNEEDHLRIQVLRSGYALQDGWDQANRIDDDLQTGLTFAFDEEWGYLTSCPTNVGTGIRVSVMLHLPALSMTKEMQKVFQAMHRMSLAVRGLYGEGSQALGDFFQISNQATLGRSEEHIINRVQHEIPQVLEYERRARQELLKHHKAQLHDQVSRAYGVLSNAQQITTEEALQLLSKVRLGMQLGLLDQLANATLNEVMLHLQPAHLQKLRQCEMDKSERDTARAAYLRERLHLN